MISYKLPKDREKKLIKMACASSLVTAFLLFNFPSYAGSISYTYDELGRVVYILYSNGTTAYCQYYAEGNCSVVTTGGGGVGSTNNTPTCVAKSITISSTASTAVKYPLSASNILSKYSDVDVNTLTVASPTKPYFVNVSKGYTKQFQHTFSDGGGGNTRKGSQLEGFEVFNG